jgi:hypothetical protein
MSTTELVTALLSAGACVEGAECIARYRPRADPAEIASLLDSAARYLDQARAALAADGGAQP